MNRSITIALALMSMTVFPGFSCEEPLNKDPGFDLWCGEELCAWTLERGEIERVSTWHRSDFGVALKGDRTTISQVSKVSSTQGVDCFELYLQAQRDPGVKIHFQMDFLNDGTIEYSRIISSQDWNPELYSIKPPPWYDSVRFIIDKTGTGQAIVTQIKIERGSECSGQAIATIARPHGAECQVTADCAEGNCLPVQQWHLDVDGGLIKTCNSCTTDNDCSAGEICGIKAGTKHWFYQTCLLEGSKLMAERCLFDSECETGFCCDGVCSQCCGASDCPDSRACQIVEWESLGPDYEFQMLPFQCTPESNQAQIGEVCLRDEDCASTNCRGLAPLNQCFLDGRSCESDDECPVFDACLPMGILGGTCI